MTSPLSVCAYLKSLIHPSAAILNAQEGPSAAVPCPRWVKMRKALYEQMLSELHRWSQPVAATLYLRGKRWSVGWNGDFIEVLLRQRRRSYGIAGSAGESLKAIGRA